MNVIAILLAIALAAVVLVLIVGVVGMARGSAFNEKYGNKMMRLRVGLQALALILVVLFVLAASQNG